MTRLQAQIDAQKQEIRARDVELESLRAHLSGQALPQTLAHTRRDYGALPNFPMSPADSAKIPETAETADRDELREHLYQTILQAWDAASFPSTNND